MEVSSLAGDMDLQRRALPLSNGAFMLSNDPIPVINPNGIIGCFHCNLVTNILNRYAVKCAVILDVEVSPYRRFLFIIRLVLQHRERNMKFLSQINNQSFLLILMKQYAMEELFLMND